MKDLEAEKLMYLEEKWGNVILNMGTSEHVCRLRGSPHNEKEDIEDVGDTRIRIEVLLSRQRQEGVEGRTEMTLKRNGVHSCLFEGEEGR